VSSLTGDYYYVPPNNERKKFCTVSAFTKRKQTFPALLSRRDSHSLSLSLYLVGASERLSLPITTASKLFNHNNDDQPTRNRYITTSLRTINPLPIVRSTSAQSSSDQILVLQGSLCNPPNVSAQAAWTLPCRALLVLATSYDSLLR
jgi:hypothetical protein